MNGSIDMGEAYEKTEHFLQRQAQRKISDEQVAMALQRGRCYYEGEIQVFFLGRKHLPAGLDGKMAERVNGTVVVVRGGRALLTTYRNPQYCKQLKRRRD